MPEEAARQFLDGAAPSGGTTNPLRVLLPLLRRHLWHGVEVLFCLLLMLLCDLAVPWSTQHLIDDVIPARDMQGLARWVAILVGAVVVGSAVTYRRIVIASTVAARVLVDLRQRCVEKYCSLSPRFLEHTLTGDVLSRITNDIDHLHGVIERIVPALVFESATLVAMAIYAIHLNGVLALIVLGVGAPVFAGMYLFTNRRLRENSRQLQDNMGSLTATANEQLANQSIIVAFGLRRWAERTLSGIFQRLLALSVRVARLDASLTAGTNIVFHGVRALVVAIGILLIFRGAMTVGALVAFLAVVTGLIAPFVTLAEYYGEIAVAGGAMERVQMLLTAREDVRSGSETFAGLHGTIELKNVTVRHAPNASALQDVSLVLPAGSFVALVGPSGAGKTTFLHTLARFFDPDIGTVLIDGCDLRSFTLESWRSQVALVTQAPLLFNASVVENVRLGRLAASGEEIAAALRAAALTDADLAHVQGDAPIGEGGAYLSGGQRQRLTIARALVRKASLLLLDEATSSLDHATERAVLAALDDYRRAGCTIVFSTHRLEAAAHADIVLSFAGGRLVRSQARQPASDQRAADAGAVSASGKPGMA
jgi:ABC-type multidrug transport system fused ATPase/permease subunit